MIGVIFGLFFKAIGGLVGLFRKPAGPSPEAVAAAGQAQATTVADVAQASAHASEREAVAVVNAPTTQAEVVTSLDNGTF